jgi:hypothetical protein
MKFLLLSLTFSISTAFAEIYKASITRIDYSKKKSEKNLIYLNTGEVIIIPRNQIYKLPLIQKHHKTGALLKIRTSKKRLLLSFETILKRKITPGSSSEKEAYFPTIIDSQEKAEEIFKNLRDNPHSRSQCYNRAHVWVYESKQFYDINSMKAFLFFTRKYIRQYNFGWWFHVAPLALVKMGDEIEEKILDNSFTTGPTSVKSWTDLFMRNKANCPVISRYSEYELNQESNYCYIQKQSMYYVQPLDLDNLEQSGLIKNRFNKYEVNRAYRNAF